METAPLVFSDPAPETMPLRQAIGAAWQADETERVEALLRQAALPDAAGRRVQATATRLVAEVRRRARAEGGLDAFVHEYDLSSREGVALMCVAEALLRIPDPETADLLIADKLFDADWEKHAGHSGSPFVNASTWALMLTGRLMQPDDAGSDLGGALRRLAARAGRPVVRQAVRQAMRIMGRQFVIGRTIEEALDSAEEADRKGYGFSFDMLGEGARTARDAERYLEAYEGAIGAIGSAARSGRLAGPGISVKLSALHPRYQYAQRERVLAELAPRLRRLALAAREAGCGLTIDAEEADRLDLSLDLFELVYRDPAFAGWDGLGLVVQAYQKRAPLVIEWIVALAREVGRRVPVRLVKGAYWDTEIKRSQVGGHADYPVFTRKIATDVSYIVCARRLLAAGDVVYAQFATHNAHTIAAVLELAGNRRDFEFQRLYGMGEALHDQIVLPSEQGGLGLRSRIYAPVGGHEELLAYLVRRLLENGANSSFVNRIVHEDLPIEEIVADPVARLRGASSKRHPRIPLPRDLYGPERPNAAGLELADPETLRRLQGDLQRAAARDWSSSAIIDGREAGGPARAVRDPADRRRIVGSVREATEQDAERALDVASKAARAWDATPAGTRAEHLRRAADLFEQHRTELMLLCIREAGRTIPAALAEVREAVDFLRYYAGQAEAGFGQPLRLAGPTGEENRLRLHGRGIFACISPWNFPLAIFTGQVAAALAAGNAVLAKPAEQTPLTAAHAVRLLHEAGVPGGVLQLLPGSGETVGARITSDGRVAGVAFTGSNDTARRIAAALALRPGPIVPFIAETGGQNAMIVDSSALPEQVIDDAIHSAYDSAGQRCSALRVIYLQSDIADRMIEMLTGAMEELRVGDPGLLATDVGPVIDEDARAPLLAHIERMKREARLLSAVPLGPDTNDGSFVAPHAFEIGSIGQLDREVFGPILHVVRWRAGDLDRVIEQIESTGYGLTLGIHSRIDETVRAVTDRIRVGNIYVNRNMIGAVVGAQPFGGEGLSGTGPKAGGPHYLPRFATERVLSVNTAAAGGNAALVTLLE